MAKSVAAADDLLPVAVAEDCGGFAESEGTAAPTPEDGEPSAPGEALEVLLGNVVADGVPVGVGEAEPLGLLGFGAGAGDAGDVCVGVGVNGARRLTVPVASKRLLESAIDVVTASGSFPVPGGNFSLGLPVLINTAKVPAPHERDSQYQSICEPLLPIWMHVPCVEDETSIPVTRPCELLLVVTTRSPRCPATEPGRVITC